MFRALRPAQLSVDAVAAGLFGLFALWSAVTIGATTGVDSLLPDVLVALLLTGAVLLRRLSPGLALAVAWLAAIAQMGFGRPPSPVDVAIFAVLYTTAAYGTRLVFWLGFASAIVGSVVIVVYLLAASLLAGGLDLTSLPTAIAVLVAALFALLLAWTSGALVRTALRARATRALQQQAEADTVAEQERVRIARDMHDVVAHSLAVVIAQADGARYAAAADPDAATAALGTISTTARAALADVRLLLTQLRHTQAEGPQPSLADLEQLYAGVRAAGAPLSVDVDPVPPGEPPAAVQLAVYRILQEALTNALRHGGGGPVGVRLSWLPDRVDVQVRNAAGADPGTRGGHGLIGMRERAQLVGGRLDAGREDADFVVRASIPIGIAA